MRKLALIFLALWIAGISNSCEEKKERFTTKSDNIDKLKSGVMAYDKGDWDAWMKSYTDSSKIYYNTWDEALSPKEALKIQKDLISQLSTYGWRPEPQFFEQTIDDDGKTWVNFWGVWEGKLKDSDNQINIPVHLSANMKDGKILEEYGFWNMAELSEQMQKKEAMKNMPVEKKKLAEQVNKFIDQFINKNNTEVLKEVIANNYVRTMNGKKVAGNTKELIANYDVFRTAFPDQNVSLSNLQVSDNDVFVNWIFTGTHNGEFNGLAPTGNKVKIFGVSRIKFTGEGKVNQEDVYYNELELMNQLGYKIAKEAG